MPLLNYTTSVEPSRSLDQITSLLVKAGASHILFEYGKDHALLAVSFKADTEYGVIAFRLPANVDRVLAVLKRQKIQPRFKTMEQANRVAWRIIKDWTEAQVALIQLGLVELVEVFLPYAQDPKTGQTVYQQMKENKFPALTWNEPVK